MKISTEIGSTSRIIGEEKAVELIANAGFDAWDFSMMSAIRYDWEKKCAIKTDHPFLGNNYLAFARKLKKIGLDNGIECNQSHAPFPTYCDEIRSHYKRAIESTAEAGGKICIIHPDNYKGAEENAEIYNELLPFAKECGVKIATENMFNWNYGPAPAACSSPESFVEHLKAVNDDYFVACLDIGHAELKGLGTSAVEMIKAIGPKLQALHIHDNDKENDKHQIPFSMNIDFDAVTKALKEIGYKGELTLEADAYLKEYNEENIFEGIKNLADSAKRLREMMK